MPLIDGVTVKPLRIHADERGYLFEMLRSDEPLFQGFGQSYVTAVYPGVVKGWHFHKKQYDQYMAGKHSKGWVAMAAMPTNAVRAMITQINTNSRGPRGLFLRISHGPDWVDAVIIDSRARRNLTPADRSAVCCSTIFASLPDCSRITRAASAPLRASHSPTH